MFEDCVAKVTGMKGDMAHIISLDELSKLPSQLNDPILLFNGSVPDSIIAITELYDKHGNDVIVAVHLNKNFRQTVINKIASLYSKTDNYGNNRIIQYVNNQINNGNLIDTSNKKAPNWFSSRGLQLPTLVQTILDANNRLSQQETSVNTHSMQNYENNSQDGKTSRDIYDVSFTPEQLKQQYRKVIMKSTDTEVLKAAAAELKRRF